MIVPKALFPIFLFVTSALAEEVYDPCSKFLGDLKTPLVKCPSEKPDDDYLECYDLDYKENKEAKVLGALKNWCWSRQDNSDDVLKNLTIFSGSNDNSDFNDKINRPFTAKFHDNGTYMFCLEDENYYNEILDGENHFACPTNTGIPLALFTFSRQRKL